MVPVGHLNAVDPAVGQVLTVPTRILIACTGDWHYVTDYVLTNWLTALVCKNAGVKLSALPSVIRARIAEYTARSLTEETLHWKAVAAAWAQDGGKLTNVPPPLNYDVGTSVVSYLVAQEGVQKFIGSLPELATDWSKEATAITPGWRAWLSGVKLT